jgi:hypothetical protein
LVSLNKKYISEHYRKFQARKTILIDIIFAMKKISVDLFRAAPYMVYIITTQRCAVPLTPNETSSEIKSSFCSFAF